MPFPEGCHASHGELLERSHGELPSPLPRCERCKEEFEEEPELSSHGYEYGGNPAQTNQAAAGEGPAVRNRAIPTTRFPRRRSRAKCSLRRRQRIVPFS